MKLTINSKDILKAVQVVGSLIKPQNTMPALDNVLFQIRNETLTLTADNLEVRSCHEIPVKSDFEHDVCINFQLFVKIVKDLPNGPIDLEFAEKEVMIKSLTGEYKIPVNPEDAGLFPTDNFAETDNEVSFNALELAEAIRKALPFVDTSNTTSLSNVLLWITPEASKVVGTSGYGCFEYTIASGGAEKKLLLTQSVSAYLTGSIMTDEDVRISYNTNHIFFNIENRRISAVLSDVQYPKYEDLMDNHNSDKLLRIQKDELLPVIKRMSNVTDKNSYIIRFNFNGDILDLSFKHSFLDVKAREVMKVDYTGDPFVIGLSARGVIGSLGVLDDEALFEFTQPNKQCRVTSGNVRCLLMPFLLAE